MDLEHRFTVPAGVEQAWAHFTDVEGVAGCFPGATVTEADDESFSGTVKVKLGPIGLLYTGSGTFVEKDEADHRLVIDAKGKDKRGNGTATALVTATMTAVGDGATEVEVRTDLTITGKAAQFGRGGVIKDVSDKLLGQFVSCIEQRLASGPVDPSSEESVPEQPMSAPEASPFVAAAVTPSAEPPRAPDGALDLGAAVVPALVRAAWRPLAAGVLAVVLLRWVRGRR